jgi:hypothetical protein
MSPSVYAVQSVNFVQRCIFAFKYKNLLTPKPKILPEDVGRTFVENLFVLPKYSLCCNAGDVTDSHILLLQ